MISKKFVKQVFVVTGIVAGGKKSLNHYSKLVLQLSNGEVHSKLQIESKYFPPLLLVVHFSQLILVLNPRR